MADYSVYFGDWENNPNYIPIEGKELAIIMCSLEENSSSDGIDDWDKVFWDYVANGNRFYKKRGINNG